MKTAATESPSLEMPDVLASRIQRGMTPVTFQEWVGQKVDPSNLLKLGLGGWIQEVSKNEQLFKKHVYDNENANQLDFRQHRARICELITAGEMLAVGFVGLGQKMSKMDEFSPFIESIDQTIKKLLDALIAWHGPLDAQSDIPADLKQSMQEIEDGKIVDLEM